MPKKSKKTKAKKVSKNHKKPPIAPGELDLQSKPSKSIFKYPGQYAFAIGLIIVFILSAIFFLLSLGKVSDEYFNLAWLLAATVIIIGIIVGVYNIGHKNPNVYLVAVLLILILQNVFLVHTLKTNLLEVFSKLQPYEEHVNLAVIFLIGFLVLYFTTIALTISLKNIFQTIFHHNPSQSHSSHYLSILGFLTPFILFVLNYKIPVFQSPYYAICSLLMIALGIYVSLTERIDFDYLIAILFTSYILLRILVVLNNASSLIQLPIDLVVSLLLTFFASTTFIPVVRILYHEAKD
jgi:hypothetical protein